MSGVQFDIKVVTGGGAAAIDGISNSLGNAVKGTATLNGALSKIAAGAFAFNQIKSAVSGIANDFNAAIQPGIDFNTQMKDLQSITGVSNEVLEKIGKSARQNAKDFGVDASAGMESYKLILSQLSPEIAKQPAALDAMGKNAAVLSKQLGGDLAGATSILTTAMNQYGVSLDDPMQASKDMADMMNIMSAAAREGSAELPQIQTALQQSGLMAKTANVSFGELNSAIQVLDKAGKKGAEGGVAIRNVLAEIGQGSRMPQIAASALDQYGISTAALADKSKTMSQRLALLAPMMNDTSAMTAVFGKENVAAAMALVQNTGEMDRLTTATADTNAAQEIANTVMGSFEEKMARANAKMKDLGISLFNATEGFLPFIKIGGSALSMAANLGGAMSAVSTISDTKFGKAMSSASTKVLGFAKNIGLSALGLLKQAVQMGISAAATLGGYVMSLVTATAAQVGLNVAMTANPIGLIIVGIGLAVAAVSMLIIYWDEIWSVIKAFGKWLWDHSPFKIFTDLIERVFPGFKQAFVDLWAWLKKKFTDLIDWFRDAWKNIKGFFGFDTEDGSAATEEQVKAMSAAVDEVLIKPLKIEPVVTDGSGAGASGGSGTGKKYEPKQSKQLSSNISSGGSKPTSISLIIQKMQNQTTIHTTTLKEGAQRAGGMVVEELLSAINSINGKVATV